VGSNAEAKQLAGSDLLPSLSDRVVAGHAGSQIHADLALIKRRLRRAMSGKWLDLGQT
jgi:hypothetical protein